MQKAIFSNLCAIFTSILFGRGRLLCLKIIHDYLGNETVPWLTSDLVLRQFSCDVQKAQNMYGRFVHEGMEEETRAEFFRGTCEARIVGDEIFAGDVLLRANQKGEPEYSLDEVVTAACSRFGISSDTLKAPGKSRPMAEARAVVAAIVQQSPHLRLVRLGCLFNRDISALGKSAQRAMDNDRLKGVMFVEKLQAATLECLNA